MPTLFSPAARIWSWVLISCTKYIDQEGLVQGSVHSYRGAKLLDFFDVIYQNPNQKLNTVVVFAGFNDHYSSIDTFIELWKFLIQLIFVKLGPNKLIVPKVIPTSCNRLISKKISALNYALYNYIYSCALKLFIVSPSFKNVLEPNLFCKDIVHFSHHGSHVLTIILFNITKYFKYRCCYYSTVINSIEPPQCSLPHSYPVA